MTMQHAALRDEICRIGSSLFQRGLVHGTAGNISVRLPAGDGFLITPADACLGFLDADGLAHVALDGTQLSGQRASKTLVLHRQIYGAADDAHAVLHTHSHHLVSLTLQGVWSNHDVLPPITPYQVMKVGHVPLVPCHRPGAAEVAEHIAALIGSYRQRQLPLHAVLCERLGPQVWHADLASAMALLEELEETARLWLAGQRAIEPLNAAQIDELRRHFNAPW